MSLKILPIPPVPEETVRIVRACFPHGALVVQLRDALGTRYSDANFADRFPTRGQPAEAPWHLALVTVLQFLEGLPDRQAADAVRSRLDRTSALSLELTDPGFDHTVLAESRTRIVAGGAAGRLLDLVLEQARARGWLKERSTHRTDSTHVLAAERALTRLESVGETLRHTLTYPECAGGSSACMLRRGCPLWKEARHVLGGIPAASCMSLKPARRTRCTSLCTSQLRPPAPLARPCLSPSTRS
jgi:transposase